MAGPPRQELTDEQRAAVQRVVDARGRLDAAEVEWWQALVEAKDGEGVTLQHLADALGYPDRRNVPPLIATARRKLDPPAGE